MLIVEENNIRKTTTGFEPRWYQEKLIRELFKGNKKKFLCNWARRGGKDLTWFNIASWWCMSKPSTSWYIFPNQPQARAAVWSGMTHEGRSFLSYIPDSAIESKNEARMEVKFRNGSLLALKGSTNHDSLRGGNPSLVVFSEHAYQDPMVYPSIVQPILQANQGIAAFISTPQGANHFFELSEIAKNTPEEWYYETLTVDDMGHIDVDKIKRDIQMGLISQDMADQEYWCDFRKGVQGSVFGRQLNKLRLDDRVTFVPYEPYHKVHVAADIGWDDEFAFIFFQVIGQAVRIIDCYANRQHAIPYYAEMLYEKKYNYGKLFLPHDAEAHNVETGNTRTQAFADLGFDCEVLPRKYKPDMIEDGRCLFAKLWMDERKCADLIKSLENYRREWDDKLQKYKEKPVHDHWSHYADAFMYAAGAVSLVGTTMTQQDADNIRARAIAKSNPWSQPGSGR